MPQVLMLTHAAWVNMERHKPEKDNKEGHNDVILRSGKKLEEATTDELVDYYKDMLT